MADKFSSYAKIEHGKTKLYHEKLEKIAKVFGVSIYQLIPRKKGYFLNRTQVI